jgi:predicted RecB family nuclease
MTKITREILESYLNCKYKAHLKMVGQQGHTSDYEELLSSYRREVKQRAINQIVAQAPASEIPRNIVLTADTLCEGPSFALDVTLDDELVSLHFDGLRKVGGASTLGNFHYVPMLFHEGRVKKEQRVLLGIYGQVLSHVQGRLPDYGVAWHEQKCIQTKVRLSPDVRVAQRVLREVKDMTCTDSPPKLLLNSHCQICEFRQRCHDLAVEKDDLSLLRGLKEKDISKLNSKGIFSITQYSYCFRPRRKRNQKSMSKKFDHSLQAMALRTKKIYVVKEPEFQAADSRVYLDVEGDTDKGFYYLIGLLIRDRDTQTYIHFWADSKAQEGEIWKQFLNYMRSFENFTLFYYGNYEKKFLLEMKKLYDCDEELFNRLILSSFNVVSAIFSGIYFPVHSNSLKSIATFLGYRWSEHDASGIQALVWRHEWEEHQSISAKERLLTYNREDCIALRVVSDGIEQLVQESREGQVEAKRAMNIDEIQPERPRSFKRNQFYLPEMCPFTVRTFCSASS